MSCGALELGAAGRSVWSIPFLANSILNLVVGRHLLTQHASGVLQAEVLRKENPCYLSRPASNKSAMFCSARRITQHKVWETQLLKNKPKHGSKVCSPGTVSIVRLDMEVGSENYAQSKALLYEPLSTSKVRIAALITHTACSMSSVCQDILSSGLWIIIGPHACESMHKHRPIYDTKLANRVAIA